MIRWLLYLYPAWFRRRYGDELIDLVARSPHLGRDVVNLVVHAGRMRWESIVTRSWKYVTNAAVAATLFGLGYTINDLAGGVGEIHRHWSSTLTLGAFVFSAAARTAVASALKNRDANSANTAQRTTCGSERSSRPRGAAFGSPFGVRPWDGAVGCNSAAASGWTCSVSVVRR